MPLADHLRELRNRLVKSLIAVAIITIVAAFNYRHIIDFLIDPVPGCNPEQIARGAGGQCGVLAVNGLLTPFTLALKVSLMAGVVVACPVWLYQLWAFLAPGLHKHEKKYTLAFVGAGIPLFIGGGVFAYSILPTTINVLLGFTPSEATNFLQIDNYLDIAVRMVLVFGLAFELPLILVLLNFGHVVSGRRMAGWWRGMIMGIFVFAAVITPSTDPLTMTLLATPITVLYLIAVVVSLINDRRRAKRRAADPDAALDDDEASQLDLEPEDLDEEPAEIAPAEPVTAQDSAEEPATGTPGAVVPSRRDAANDDIT